jgi:hypothetical protein
MYGECTYHRTVMFKRSAWCWAGRALALSPWAYVPFRLALQVAGMIFRKEPFFKGHDNYDQLVKSAHIHHIPVVTGLGTYDVIVCAYLGGGCVCVCVCVCVCACVRACPSIAFSFRSTLP